jgi:hypothetical protein
LILSTELDDEQAATNNATTHTHNKLRIFFITASFLFNNTDATPSGKPAALSQETANAALRQTALLPRPLRVHPFTREGESTATTNCFSQVMQNGENKRTTPLQVSGFLWFCFWFLSPFLFVYEPRSAKHFERILAEFVCARIAALSKQTNCVKRRQKAKRPSSRT